MTAMIITNGTEMTEETMAIISRFGFVKTKRRPMYQAALCYIKQS
jgi:hypothetical protein